MSNTIESEKDAAATEAPQPKAQRGAAKKPKPAKKAGRTKKSAAKSKANSAPKSRGNFNDEAAKGATLAETMAATEWQAHTVRGFVSILGSKGGERIESSKNASGERTYKISKQLLQATRRPNAASATARAAFLAFRPT